MEKKSFSEKMAGWVEEKMAPALSKIFDRPVFNIIKDAMMGAMPMIIIGSIACIIATLGTNSIGNRVILPFLSPLVDQIYLIQNLSLGCLTLYFTIAFGIRFAKEYDLDTTACAIISFGSLLFIGISDGIGSITSVAGAGALFVSMLTNFAALYLYRFMVIKKVTIKMPKGVPPMVANSFSALIPDAAVILLFWLVRTIMKLDLVSLSSMLLTPMFKGADNVVSFGLYNLLTKLCWSIGLHDTMFSGVITPLTTYWTAENAAAVAAGAAPQYTWTVALERTCMWVGPNIGIMLLCLRSRIKYLREIGKTALLPVMFGVGEPIVFGVIIFNPYMMLPFVIIPTVTAILNYIMVDCGLLARCFVELPWATPPFIIGFLGSGDWKYIIMSLVNLAIGYFGFKPFFKIWENKLLADERAGEEIGA